MWFCSQQVTEFSVSYSESTPNIEHCAGFHIAHCLLFTVSPSTRIKPTELEAHHTSPFLPEFHNNVMYPCIIHFPSSRYIRHFTSIYFTTVSPSPQFVFAVVFVTIRWRQFTLIILFWNFTTF